MSHSDHSPFSREIAAVTAWWQEAGVDHTFLDNAQVWLAEDESLQSAKKPARNLAADETNNVEALLERSQIGGPVESWPSNLATFQSWWLTNVSDALAAPGKPVAPMGVTNSELMLLVDHPAQDDEVRLLDGSMGAFVERMMAAFGLNAEKTYLASMLPVHTPLADWEEMIASGLGELTKHHIALAQPKRLMVLGSSALSLLGHDPAQAPAEIREIGIQGRTVPTLACWALDRLYQRPKARKVLWQRWLDWTEN